MTRHIIVIGKTGQLARALTDQAGLFDCQIQSYDRVACDLSAPAADITAFAQSLPHCDGVIIAAAYTAVDAAEVNEDTAFKVNAAAPAIFAALCRARDIPLVHVSTDYVFGGEHFAPLSPQAATDPINAYGRSKLAGEVAITQSGARAAILRTSWVFDGTGKNFLTSMLRLGETREQLNIVADQIGRPTYAGHLAQACLTALVKLVKDKNLQGGIYHVSGGGASVSWAGFAESIFAATTDSRNHAVIITSIPTSEYPTPAKRPAYSVLDISRFERDFQMIMPDWKAGLDAALRERRAR